MKKINKSVLVTHSAEQMYHLVNTVEDYPKFLPWCSKSDILKRKDNMLEAVLYMDYLSVRQNFSTRNTNQAPHSIHIELLNGPFRSLSGYWHFKSLEDLGCKVEFSLQYEFSSTILSMMIGPVFNRIADTLIDAFVTEANKRYGT